jgi:GntR family transcriptional repressor for pyruvate dehydrogenase complex
MELHGKLRTVKRLTLYEQVFEEIKRYIIDNDLQAGDRLPTEREMSETLSVSRHSVREALKSLEFMGVLSSQPKNGYTMQPFTLRLVTDQIMFRFPKEKEQLPQINDCRRLLELAALDLVLANVKEWDFDKMEHHISAAGGNLHDPEEFENQCARFHDAVFSSAGNEILRGQFEIVSEFYRRASVKIPIGPVDGRVAALEARKSLIAALKAKDRVKAAEAINAYNDYYQRPEVITAMGLTLLPASRQTMG